MNRALIAKCINDLINDLQWLIKLYQPELISKRHMTSVAKVNTLPSNEGALNRSSLSGLELILAKALYC